MFPRFSQSDIAHAFRVVGSQVSYVDRHYFSTCQLTTPRGLRLHFPRDAYFSKAI